MLGSFLGVGISNQNGAARPRRSAVPVLPGLLFAVAWIGSAAASQADWQLDYEPGEWRIAALEQKRDGYLEHERIAIGCSLAQELFIERYTPAGSRPASVVILNGDTETLVVWDRVYVPNTMRLFDDRALALVVALMRASRIGVREVDVIDRVEIVFPLERVAVAVQPVLDWCGYPPSPPSEIAAKPPTHL